MLGVKTGTRVSDVRSDLEAYGGRDPTVKGFATIDNVSLISIEVCVGQLLTERAVQCSAVPQKRKSVRHRPAKTVMRGSNQRLLCTS